DVGEHERLAELAGSAPPILQVPLLACSGFGGEPGSKRDALVGRGRELRVGVAFVVEQSEGPGQDGPGPGHLEGRPDLAPATDRGAQLPRRPGWVALGEQAPPERHLAAALQARRWMKRGDPADLVDRGPGPGDIADGDGD